MFPVLPDQLLSVSRASPGPARGEGDLVPVSLGEGVRGAREGVGGRRVEITETPVLGLPAGVENWGRVRHLLTVGQLDQNQKVGVLQNSLNNLIFDIWFVGIVVVLVF